MAGAERGPGIIEYSNRVLGNVDILVAGIAYFLGYLGVAALAAMSAVINHGIAGYMKERRTKGKMAFA